MLTAIKNALLEVQIKHGEPIIDRIDYPQLEHDVNDELHCGFGGTIVEVLEEIRDTTGLEVYTLG